jgi:hypothetical protein
MNIRALVIAGSLILGTGLAAQAQVTIPRSVIGCGFTSASGSISGVSYNVFGTIGQSVIGPTTTAPWIDYQGFWTPQTPSLGVKEEPVGNADGFSLEQNYPNPFNPSTTIKYSIAERSHVIIRLMNLLGQEVHAPLVDEEEVPGSYQFDFTDADNLPSGTYIYRMDAGTFTASKRMVLLK